MEWVAALLFVSVILVLLAGFPVAFTLGGTALIFAGFGILGGGFNEALLLGLPNRVFGIMTNETLVAVPLFVFMGVTLVMRSSGQRSQRSCSRRSAACLAHCAVGWVSRSRWSACCSQPAPASLVPPSSQWACCHCRQ